MKYKNYNNGTNYLILGLLMMMFFGGFQILFVTVSIFSLLIIRFFPLILISFFLYRFFKKTKYNARMGNFVNSNPLDKSQFVELLIRVLIHSVKADGKVDQKELQVIYHFFEFNLQYNPTQMQWVRDLVQHSLKTGVPLNELTSEINASYSLDIRLIILQLVYRIIYADEIMTQGEQHFVEQLVSQLQIPVNEHEKVKAMFVQFNQDDRHYKVLEVSPSVSKEELKKAYRDACKKYHPDKVHHLGDEFKKVAEEKMQKVNESYQVLLKKFAT